ncbi:uncharacterized protein [Littorina saxatilis]|uniref:Uncharacterized protein n=1 Tax=Littorina saxatilis TaxID=31220 RepID=A0AAN9ARG0_9CAEN
MNTLISLFVVAVGVGTISAQGYGGGPSYGGGPNYGGGPPHGGRPTHGGAGSGASGSGSGAHVGYGRYNYYPPPPPPKKDDMPLTELDQLNDRFNNVLDQLKTSAEIIEALSAQMSLQKQFIDAFNLLTQPELEQTDVSQNAIISQLQDAIDAVNTTLSGGLTDSVGDLNALNDQNTDAQTLAEELFAQEQAIDVGQDRDIQTLYALARGLKEKLFQVEDNAFEVFTDAVENNAQRLASVSAEESRRVCESGKVTLDSDDRRVEYQYKRHFPFTPIIYTGLSGFSFNIDSREPSYGYGYGYQAKEPHSIGIRTAAYSTPTGLSIELFDTGFGESTVVTGTVSFMACLIEH